MQGFPNPQETIAALLREQAVRSGDKTAVRVLHDHTGHEDSLSYRRLYQRSLTIAAFLRQRAARGERALLLLPTSLDYVTAFFGCLYAGIIAVPVYPPESSKPQHRERLHAIASDASPRLLLTQTNFLEIMELFRSCLPDPGYADIIAIDAIGDDGMILEGPNPTGEDIAFLQYTSGSTSTPKGVMVSHANILANATAITNGFGCETSDVFVSWLPLFHDMGLIGCLMQSIACGASIVLMSPRYFLERPLRWLEALTDYRATVSGGPDFAFRLCIERIADPVPKALDLSPWRIAFCGSEPIRPETFRQFTEKFSAAGLSTQAFHPCYGLAEATLFVSAKRPGHKAEIASLSAPTSIGGEISPAQTAVTLISCGDSSGALDIRLVDPVTQVEVAPGAIGEIWAHGPNIAQGYWQNPQASRETFIETEGRRFLRTGDLGCWQDGQLYIAGRLKDLIIIRGHNLYPQDLERTIEREVTVIRQGRIAAFPVEINGVEAIGIAAEINRRMQKLIDPEAVATSICALLADVYQEGAAIVLLLNPGALPLTSSGKLQRSACWQRFQKGTLDTFAVWRQGRDPQETPTSLHDAGLPATHTIDHETEGRLAAIWAEVLRREAVSRDDHFFLLGGNSLLVTQVMARLAEEWQLAAPLRLLFEKPVLGPFAEAIAKLRLEQKAAGEEAPLRIAPAPRDQPLALSFAQSRLWFLWRLEPHSPAYNLSLSLALRGPLQSGALKEALRALVQRHECLRTSFIEIDGEAHQNVNGSEPFDLIIVDLRGLPPQLFEEQLAQLTDLNAAKPFDLRHGPLLRAILIHEADDKHRLLLTAHHIIADGWSLTIFLRECAALYAAYSRGEAPALPPLTVQYADYALWQRQWLAGAEGKRQRTYWHERLGGTHPLLTLPFDHPRPAVQSYRGGAISFRLEKDLVARLASLAQAQDATLFMVLFAAFATLLHRLSGQGDLRIGVPVANRRLVETESLIGFFVNTLVLRSHVRGSDTFSSLLEQIKETVIGAQSHQDLPFEMLVDELQSARSLAHNPLFQVKFNYGIAPPETAGFGDLAIDAIAVKPVGTHFDLALDLTDAGAAIDGLFTYASDLFNAETITAWSADYIRLLEAVAARPEAKLNLLFERPEARFAGAKLFLPVTDILTLRQQHPAVDPDALALHGVASHYSQRQLEESANRLAHLLRARGIGRMHTVALVIERSPEWVIGLLGILKTGAAFVPLDPAFPSERLESLIAECGASAVVGLGEPFARLRASSILARSLPFLSLEAKTLADFSPEPPHVPLMADEAAYIIYTSGSTGRPKGVVISHRALAAYVQGLIETIRFPVDTSMAMVSSVAADLGHTIIFASLCTGRPLYLPSPETVSDPELCADYLASHRIGVLKIVPGHLRALLQIERPARLLPEHVLILGGESCPADLIEEIHALKPACRIINHYGPTETTVGVLTDEISTGPDIRVSVPLGKPLPNTYVTVLNDDLDTITSNISGELYIGGITLAQGYLGRPALTAERFIPDPDGSGTRLYRSGDHVKYDDIGRIAFLGRADDQVKIRGYRVEPAEVAFALRQVDGVKDAIVVGYGPDEAKELIAYCVLAQPDENQKAALRATLESRLPSHLIPAHIIPVAKIPLTANGKCDHAALPPPLIAAYDPAEPETEIEEKLLGIWREVLRRETLGVTDNFFEVGGDSIRSLQVIARMRKQGLHATPKQVFEFQTIRALAGVLQPKEAQSAGYTFPRADRNTPLPLSHAQNRIRFLWEMEPDNPVYNVAGALRLQGKLDPAALEKAFHALVARHEILRTTFPVGPCGYEQKIHDETDISVTMVDISALAPAERDREVKALISKEARRVFNLEQGPLLYVTLLNAGSDDYRLLVTMHHIISDGWSLNIFMDEFSEFYSAAVEGRAASLPSLPMHYADYAVWQREWLGGEEGERQRAYWKQRLDGLSGPIALPIDRPRPEKQSYRGATHPFALPASLVHALKDFARSRSVTLSTLLLTAWMILLYRYSGEADQRFGLPVANRRWAETEGLIGFFVNMLVLRADLSDDPGFDTLLQQVSALVIEAQTHQDLPFEQVVEMLNPERTLAYNPLFQVSYNHRQRDYTPLTRLAGLEATEPRSDTPITQFDLTFNTEENGEHLKTSITYSTDLFDPPTIAQMAGHFVTLVEAVLRNPAQTICSLSLDGPAAPERLTDNAPVIASVHGLVEEQAAAIPDRLAIISGTESLTYAALNARANRLARKLRDLGAGPERRVGLYLNRQPDMVVAMLAILKAGGAYLPLAPDYPAERIAFMIRDAQPCVVLTETHLLQSLAAHSGEASALTDSSFWCLDRGGDALDTYAGTDLGLPIAPSQCAYCIYTSGSSGRPKGVAVSHSALLNHMQWMRESFAFGPEERVLQKTPFSFDASVWEFWLPLILGGQCVLASAEASRDPALLWRDVIRHKVTILQCVPSLLRVLLDQPEAAARHHLQHLFCGGEALAPALARAALQDWQGALWNLYGPTEATIDATFWQCRDVAQPSIPIGMPISGTTIYILDSAFNKVPAGVVGEIHIAGAGLARGYLGRPGLTAERFVPNPFTGDGGRLYRTGDLGRWRADSAIDYVGRIDQQVKLRGFRIELEEIAACLAEHEGVREAIVIARETGAAGRQLVGYVVPDRDQLKAAYRRDEGTDMVSQWESVFETAYEGIPHGPNFSGWTSSYTDAPIPEVEMRDWLENTVARIAALRPRRLLEIGCGIGLLVQRLAPLCKTYYATDFSARALADLGAWLRGQPQLSHVRLARCEAGQIASIALGDKAHAKPFDQVVLNSVIQYFPDADYLMNVLRAAASLLSDDGNIFIGDVRHFALMHMFHTSVQFARAPESLDLHQLRMRIDKAIAQDKELVLDPRFFHAVAGLLGFTAQISLKRAHDGNELTCYRYDVVLSRGKAGAEDPCFAWQALAGGLPEIARRLATERPAFLKIQNIPNRRLSRENRLMELVCASDRTMTVAALRAALARSPMNGEDPEAFWHIGEMNGFDVSVSWTPESDQGAFDITFRDLAQAHTVPQGIIASTHSVPQPDTDWRAYATDPLGTLLVRRLGARLREAVSKQLPDYMVPSVIMPLASLPLSANGKVDRKALPAPDITEAQKDYVAPRNASESKLTGIWQDILQIPRIGIHDNFFDLGGHSLLATQVISRIRKECSVSIPLRCLFEKPTIAELAHTFDGLSETSLTAEKIDRFEALFDQMGI